MNLPALATPTTIPNVFIHNEKAITTSKAVGEFFRKLHKNVIRAIESLECSPEFTRLNFELSEYTDITGRKLPMYEMTKDGFVFLVMGFTGKKAAAFKEAYIAEFNRMEAELNHRKPVSIPKPLIHTITLTDEELCDICWLWKISDNMQQAAKKIYPGLLELGSQHTGVCRDAAYESVQTIKRVRNTLLRVTTKAEFAPELSPNWRRILPQLRQPS
ncbi:Rha family transcriptional regulator [Salmonella enterica]|nr:Rha family transcriptional regulator [Salmonella enterica]EJA5147323.1 Rha family transcriptional regulator [Salmonella enterica]EJX4290258.1 Rha family transcriptional regulator [Salmonella enterica]EJX4688194.1 Rha family transcriptional regulator [Salmonella enterica]EJX4770379.1 Rha family transcriptional regulator [Salmonella enterica]